MGSGSLKHLVMPSLAVGLSAGCGLARLLRTQILTHAKSEHVLAARVFCVKNSTILRNYIIKNAIPPVITNIGLVSAGMLRRPAIIVTLFL